MPFFIELVKDIYPEANLANYEVLSSIVNKEFGAVVPTAEFERYFSPSVDALEEEYKYKLKMSLNEHY